MASFSKYLFLDRDGTLIQNKHYLSDPEQVEFCEGAIEGLLGLKSAGYRLVVVTNQSGIGRGYFTVEQMEAVHKRIKENLFRKGILIEEILYCPHRPEEECDCRKPKAGMIKNYLKEKNLIEIEGWVIGDRWCDIEMARRAKLRSVWIENQRHPEEIPRCRQYSDIVASSIEEAAQLIIG